MLTTALIGFLTIARPGPVPEQEVLAGAEAAFRQAVEARGDPVRARRLFGEAADAYQALSEGGARNPDLYLNLGHAEMLAGRLPRAILAYRRGLRLAPQDRRLQESLELARDQVEYPPGRPGRPPASPWPSWLSLPGPGVLLGLALCCYVLGCAALTRWLMVRRGATLAQAVVALVLLSALVLCWGALRPQEADFSPVVVAADGVPLRTGNGPAYPANQALPVLNRGMEGRLLFVRGDWLQVELPGGPVGWVPRRQVLLDEP